MQVTGRGRRETSGHARQCRGPTVAFHRSARVIGCPISYSRGMRCPRCGIEVSEHQKFCHECGTDLSTVIDADLDTATGRSHRTRGTPTHGRHRTRRPRHRTHRGHRTRGDRTHRGHRTRRGHRTHRGAGGITGRRVRPAGDRRDACGVRRERRPHRLPDTTRAVPAPHHLPPRHLRHRRDADDHRCRRHRPANHTTRAGDRHRSAVAGRARLQPRRRRLHRHGGDGARWAARLFRAPLGCRARRRRRPRPRRMGGPGDRPRRVADRHRRVDHPHLVGAVHAHGHPRPGMVVDPRCRCGGPHRVLRLTSFDRQRRSASAQPARRRDHRCRHGGAGLRPARAGRRGVRRQLPLGRPEP